MPFGGVIVNRMHLEADVDDPAVPAGVDPDLERRLIENFEDFHALAQRDRRNVEELTAGLGERELIIVPYLDEDIHDLAGIEAVNDHLFTVAQTGAE